MAKDYSKLSKEDLIKKIEKLESRKKYGLIWDEEKVKEKFEREAEGTQDYFGIRYNYEGAVYTFYPDYLVRFKDKRIGIFEVKDSKDRDGRTLTRAKAEALQDWIKTQKRKDIFGGIVTRANSNWLINDRYKYDWARVERDDWSDWSPLII